MSNIFLFFCYLIDDSFGFIIKNVNELEIVIVDFVIGVCIGRKVIPFRTAENKIQRLDLVKCIKLTTKRCVSR